MPPLTRCKHEFTRDETSRLVDREKTYIDDFESKGGKAFGATVHFGEEKGNPGKEIVPEFG